MSASSNNYLTINAASGHELDAVSKAWGFEDRYKGESDVSFRTRLVSYIRAMDIREKAYRVLGGRVTLCKAISNFEYQEQKIFADHVYVIRYHMGSAQNHRAQSELVRGITDRGDAELMPVADCHFKPFEGYQPQTRPIEERLGEVVEGDVTAGGRTVEPQPFTPVEPNDDEEMSVDDMLGHYEVLRLRAEEINQAAAIANAELNGALLKLELLFESRGWNISRIKGDVK
ncbi:hypothetical protein HWC07_gp120 [Pantoea phage vB_PagM_LIET2]|uniref:Uncharacterized protein n=1 Tax=Pantoea phage vB_PagM_LIET2 TaxID=2508071 RepID=A0A411AW95_9CAUD|nr:hypothetical protein HWC07_gp120 [Pantoea phage vB_PagM_LIET2]QAX92372.1 hypothetical protein LIET2_gp120 [Pantoea phage vB_PagM_LIET2]